MSYQFLKCYFHLSGFDGLYSTFDSASSTSRTNFMKSSVRLSGEDVIILLLYNVIRCSANIRK